MNKNYYYYYSCVSLFNYFYYYLLSRRMSRLNRNERNYRKDGSSASYSGGGKGGGKVRGAFFNPDESGEKYAHRILLIRRTPGAPSPPQPSLPTPPYGFLPSTACFSVHIPHFSVFEHYAPNFVFFFFRLSRF